MTLPVDLSHIPGAATKWPDLLPGTYQVESQYSPIYNCIAWAAEDVTRPWWPQNPTLAHWPQGAPDEETLEAFIAAFLRLGYEECPTYAYEPGYVKVAIYADATGEPKHIAKQIDNQWWSSKLGDFEDIRHTLRALDGPHYGTAQRFLRRPLVRVKSAERDLLYRAVAVIVMILVLVLVLLFTCSGSPNSA